MPKAQVWGLVGYGIFCALTLIVTITAVVVASNEKPGSYRGVTQFGPNGWMILYPARHD